jgi:hypothetical protein
MATALNEMQFEILPFADAEEGVPFGIGLEVSIDEDGFSPGGPDWATQDAENPLNGATNFGRDHLLGPTWLWSAHANGDDTESAVQAMENLAAAWRAREIREIPGEVTAIRYQLAGRTRRVFGRPRRWSGSPDNLILSGYAPITMDFKCSDANVYDDAETVVNVGLITGSDGGFVFPVTFPVTTLPPGESDLQGLVGGTQPTYPIIRFDGPITNPTLETNDWAVSLDMTIGVGEYVEIDTRPWAQTVLLNGSASVAGALGHRQWLSRMVLEPGRHDFLFRGNAASLGSACEVRWRSAWSSI